MFHNKFEKLQIQTPGVSQELTVLAPGHMAPTGPAMEGQPSKRKRRKSASGEVCAFISKRFL